MRYIRPLFILLGLGLLVNGFAFATPAYQFEGCEDVENPIFLVFASSSGCPIPDKPTLDGDEETSTFGTTSQGLTAAQPEGCPEGQVEVTAADGTTRCEEGGVTSVQPGAGDSLISSAGTDCTGLSTQPVGESVMAGATTFNWNAVSNPPQTGYKYIVRLFDAEGGVVASARAGTNTSATLEIPDMSGDYRWDVLLVLDMDPENIPGEMPVCRALGPTFSVEGTDDSGDDVVGNFAPVGIDCSGLNALQPTDATGYGNQTFQWQWANGTPSGVTRYEVRLFTTGDYTATPALPFYTQSTTELSTNINLGEVLATNFPATLVSFLRWEVVVFQGNSELCTVPATAGFIGVDVSNAPLTTFGGDGGEEEATPPGGY